MHQIIADFNSKLLTCGHNKIIATVIFFFVFHSTLFGLGNVATQTRHNTRKIHVRWELDGPKNGGWINHYYFIFIFKSKQNTICLLCRNIACLIVMSRHSPWHGSFKLIRIAHKPITSTEFSNVVAFFLYSLL